MGEQSESNAFLDEVKWIARDGYPQYYGYYIVFYEYDQPDKLDRGFGWGISLYDAAGFIDLLVGVSPVGYINIDSYASKFFVALMKERERLNERN